MDHVIVVMPLVAIMVVVGCIFVGVVILRHHETQVHDKSARQ